MIRHGVSKRVVSSKMGRGFHSSHPYSHMKVMGSTLADDDAGHDVKTQDYGLNNEERMSKHGSKFKREGDVTHDKHYTKDALKAGVHHRQGYSHVNNITSMPNIFHSPNTRTNDNDDEVKIRHEESPVTRQPRRRGARASGKNTSSSRNRNATMSLSKRKAMLPTLSSKTKKRPRNESEKESMSKKLRRR